jgi:hypothetical protein
MRMAALVDVTVLQGDLRTVAVQLPAGYEVTAVSGNSLETSEPRDGGLVLTFADATSRSHQFLVTLERPLESGSFTTETGFVAVRDVQRERGEIAVEGVGTLELNAAERDGMHRIDVRELNPSLQSLSRLPMLSAFRYQRAAAAPPSLTLDVKRFADAAVLAAVADRAVATTLVTSEGRALTEVSLQIQNRAQPFLKVTLPSGATMVSVDVAGEAAKPVLGSDGVRVPLLRPGFRPSGTYQVSFVYVHAGTPFARKGDMQMMLPKMDAPIGLVQWEIFFPERYSVRTVAGNAIDVASVAGVAGVGTFVSNAPVPAINRVQPTDVIEIEAAGVPGRIRGVVRDPGGSVIPGVTVTLTVNGAGHTATTDGSGSFTFVGIPPGVVTLDTRLSGFDTTQVTFTYQGQGLRMKLAMRAGALAESVTVTAAAPIVDVQSAARTTTFGGGTNDRAEPRPRAPQTVAPSENVINLQRRTSGVLPIRVDVPRAGTSHQFVKPLVVDQETTVTMRYKRR